MLRRLASFCGLNDYNLIQLSTIQRPKWLGKSQHLVPRLKIHFEPVRDITDADVDLCARLIESYHQAGDTRTEGIWSEIIGAHYAGLLSALNDREATRLATLLAGMFNQKFMFGISSIILHNPQHNRLSDILWSVKFLNTLTSLAEYLGVVRTENPEQGITAYALTEGGCEGLVARIEKMIGIRIDAPRVGAPQGAKIGGRLITSEAAEFLYVAVRASRVLCNGGTVSEIGAGYGGMAYWLSELRPDIGAYTIYDLPLMNVLQGYYLSKTLGLEAVSLYGEKRRKIAVLPSQALEEAPCDLLINENSMPEMPEQAVLEYLRWARRNCRLFYSYNQEAYTPHSPQVLVPDAVAQIGGLTRLSRSLSWLRLGYVEEIYENDSRVVVDAGLR